jgi:hypothetical protein
MKYLKSILLTSLFLAMFPSNIYAQNARTAATVKNRASVQEKMEVREEKRERVEGERRENIISYSNQMIARLEATIQRIESLNTRIGTRIDKIKENNPNINLTSILNLLNKSKESVGSANEELTNLKTNLSTIVNSDTPKNSFEKVRASVKLIKTDLQTAHTSLTKIIGLIKGLRFGTQK